MADLDVLVVGAGPAGLATAVGLALRGQKVRVIERLAAPWDKACGEGLMAPGLAALGRLGIPPVALLGQTLTGVRYVDGAVTLPLPFGAEQALGLRRTRLCAALRVRAVSLGVQLEQATLTALGPPSWAGREATLMAPAPADATLADEPRAEQLQQVRARWVVGADGLRSRVRRLAGLEGAAASRKKRFGLRQHLAIAPWSSEIEVHLAPELEAYITPIATDTINLAFLSHKPLTSLAEGLAHFPALQARLGEFAAASRARGAGPLCQPVLAISAPGVALVGDASGYVDANTGEGLSLALLAAESLAMRLARAPSPTAVVPGYERFVRRLQRRYRLATKGLLWLGRYPRLRRVLMRLLGFGGGQAALSWATALPRDPALVRSPAP